MSSSSSSSSFPPSGLSSSSSSGGPLFVPATAVVVRTSASSLWFDFNGSQYVARNGVLVTLAYDPANQVFNLTSTLGGCHPPSPMKMGR